MIGHMPAHRSPTPYNPRTSLRILSSVLTLLIFASLTMILSNLARDLADTLAQPGTYTGDSGHAGDRSRDVSER